MGLSVTDPVRSLLEISLDRAEAKIPKPAEQAAAQ
jgi:hypothetical protein